MLRALSIRFARNGGHGSIEESEILNLRWDFLWYGVISGCAFLHCKKGTKADLNTVPRGSHALVQAPGATGTGGNRRGGGGKETAEEGGTGKRGAAKGKEARKGGEAKSEQDQVGPRGHKGDASARTVYTTLREAPTANSRELPSNGPKAAIMLPRPFVSRFAAMRW